MQHHVNTLSPIRAGKQAQRVQLHPNLPSIKPGTSFAREGEEQRLRAFVVLSIPEGESLGSGVYHFVRVLRSSALDPEQLLPVVLLVKNKEQITPRLTK